ncbi:MAG: mechanosensitive ion channel family protein [Candidatus Nanopelagicales bacterium]
MIDLAAEGTTLLSGAWGHVLVIAIVLIAATAMHMLANRMIQRAVARWIKVGHSRGESLTDTPEETVELQSMIMAQRRDQRAQAIGQLLRNALILTIWGLAILLILAELGVNIAPIMASAGVVGIALGFGAQALVKDYFSGFFMIVEDQYGVGDLVDVGPVVGTVEEITLRVTRIRDVNGVVWYVRNGEILRVANQSQGWTMAMAVIPVAYSADLEKVRSIVRDVGLQMYNDPDTRQMLLGRPKFAGVESVSGEAVYIRVMAKARAADTTNLSRRLREELKIAFDTNGVVVPMLQRPVNFGPDGTPLPPGTIPPR